LEIIGDLNLTTLSKAAIAAKRSVFVCSAFVKADAFDQLSSEVSPGCETTLIARWQFRDLVSGVSDLNAYEIAVDRNWGFYFNQDLHAKLYIFDEEAIVGSSNLTGKGLAGSPPTGNIELSTTLRVQSELREWCYHLLSRSTKIDAVLYKAICQDVEAYKETHGNLLPTRRGFSENVLSILRQRYSKPRIYLYDLPQLRHPDQLVDASAALEDSSMIHDRHVFGISRSASRESIQKAFSVSPGFTWLTSIADRPISFGELSSIFHGVLCDEPRPYRSEVKDRLRNLLNWTVELFPSEFKIERPNYTEIFSRH